MTILNFASVAIETSSKILQINSAESMTGIAAGNVAFIESSTRPREIESINNGARQLTLTSNWDAATVTASPCSVQTIPVSAAGAVAKATGQIDALVASGTELQAHFAGYDSLTLSTGAAKIGESRGGTVQGTLNSLILGQRGGLIAFTTYDLLDAYTPANIAEQVTSYKVTNDPDPSKNGYYHWVSGTAYAKDADLAVGEIAVGNPDALSGATVYNALTITGTGVNLYSSDLMDTPNIGINNVGVVGANAGWVLAKIPVAPNTLYCFSHADAAYTPSQVGLLGFYDASNVQLSAVSQAGLANASPAGKQFTTPDNCTQIWINVVVLARDYRATFQLELGSTVSTFEAFSAGISGITNKSVVDFIARSKALINDAGIAQINELHVLKETYNVVASGNTVNTTKVQTDYVFDLVGLTVTSGQAFTLSFKMYCDDTNAASLNVLFFQNDVATPADITGTQTATFALGTYDAPTQTYTLSTNFTASSFRYLHAYVGVELSSPAALTAFKHSLFALTLNGQPTINAPVAGGLFRDNGTGSIIKNDYIPESFISGKQLENNTVTYEKVAQMISDFITTGDIEAAIAALSDELMTSTEVDTAIASATTDFVTDTEQTTALATVVDYVNSKNPLYGKKLIVNGDSMVRGHTLTSAQVWGAKIAARNNMTWVNYGINGTQLTNDNAAGLSVLNRIDAMDDDADFVGLFAGTNDQTAVIPIGTDSDSFANGEETFKGALNDACKALLDKYPTKKVFFITPYKRNEAVKAYITAIIERCRDHSIPVFDNLTNGSVDWSNAAQIAAITLGDTYHLNEAGMDYVVPKYEAFLRGI